jgi:hypothetical protein
MRPLRPLLSLFIVILGLLILGDALCPTEVEARPRKCALVDDDWEPSEGKSADGKDRYTDDPEYEVYILQALNLAGYDTDVFEIWPDGATAPQRPTLADLENYQLVLWNCAANDSAVLQEVEMILLVDYLSLGGKVLLSGQGILDDLVRNDGNPIHEDFMYEILGVDVPFLNYFGQEFQAIPFGYFEGLDPVMPQYSSLPDPDPNKVDPMWVRPVMDAYMVGFFPGHPDELLPISSNRFKWQPIHFQSFMAEAIGDLQTRADWLSASMEWLGFEGDNLYDFMLGMEDFQPVLITPPQGVAFNITHRHVNFHSSGSDEGATRQEKDLIPLGGDWRVGETFLVNDAGIDSWMTLLALQGFRGLDVRIHSSPVWPEQFEIVYTLYLNGDPVFQDSFDGLSSDEFYRLQLSYTEDTASETSAQLTDSLGNILWTSTALFHPSFEKCYIEAAGDGTPGAQAITGWIDDLFFEGPFSHEGSTPVAVGFFELTPASGGVDLRWEVEEHNSGSEFRLTRNGEPVDFENYGDEFFAQDRNPSLREGGLFHYELMGRTQGEDWNLLRGESIRLDRAQSAPLRLLGAHPNPFNPSTEIRYELSRESTIRLAVFDLEGRRVKLLLDEKRPAGAASVIWDGRDDQGRHLTSGIYLLKLMGPGSVETTKLVMLK